MFSCSAGGSPLSNQSEVLSQKSGYYQKAKLLRCYQYIAICKQNFYTNINCKYLQLLRSRRTFVDSFDSQSVGPFFFTLFCLCLGTQSSRSTTVARKRRKLSLTNTSPPTATSWSFPMMCLTFTLFLLPASLDSNHSTAISFAFRGIWNFALHDCAPFVVRRHI